MLSTAAAPPGEVRPFLDAIALSPDAVFVTDRANRIVLWNKAVEHLLGYTDHEVTGAACPSIVCGEDRFGNRYCSAPCPVVQIAARGESVRRFELAVRSKSGTVVHVEVTILSLAAPPPHHFLLSHIIRPIAPRDEMAVPPSNVHTSAPVVDARVQKLTRREREILAMLGSGVSSAGIAERLGISPITARNHVQNVLEKLEVHSKAEAVAFAFRHKLV